MEPLTKGTCEQLPATPFSKEDGIVYVAIPYSADPRHSVKRSKYWVRQLLLKGYTPFSPVLHTHYFAVWLNTQKDKDEYPEVDYVKWDLTICEALIRYCVVFCPLYNNWDFVESKGCAQEFLYAENMGVPRYEIQPFLEGKREIISSEQWFQRKEKLDNAVDVSK